MWFLLDTTIITASLVVIGTYSESNYSIRFDIDMIEWPGKSNSRSLKF